MEIDVPLTNKRKLCTSRSDEELGINDLFEEDKVAFHPCGLGLLIAIPLELLECFFRDCQLVHDLTGRS